jgi:hypothetical protein
MWLTHLHGSPVTQTVKCLLGKQLAAASAGGHGGSRGALSLAALQTYAPLPPCQCVFTVTFCSAEV